MAKIDSGDSWFKEVEAVEEKLEDMKLRAWLVSSRLEGPRNIVKSTAGLLKGKISAGRVYERRLRRAWGLLTKRHAL